MGIESIKYMGSKRKLLSHIDEIIEPLKINNILDGFSGSTIVSQMFSKKNYKVWCNDIAPYSKNFGITHLIENKNDSYYQTIIDNINSLKPIEGWFTENYIKLDKFPISLTNLMKLDSIQNWISENIDPKSNEWHVLKTSLIYAIDKIDNTMGHWSSYLRVPSSRSLKDLKLQIPVMYEHSITHTVTQEDILNLNISNEYDLVYLDPPYGSNNEKMPSSRVRYNAYYHFYKTVSLNDKPELFGKVGRRKDSSDKIDNNVFEEYRKNNKGDILLYYSFSKMFDKCNSRYVLLSYNSNSRISIDSLISITGKYKLKFMNAISHKKNCMAFMKSSEEWNLPLENEEFLILFENSENTE